MERLTNRAYGGSAYLTSINFPPSSADIKTRVAFIESLSGNNTITQAIERLAAYEDAEEQGRLVEIVHCADCQRKPKCDIYKHFGTDDFYCKHGKAKEN